MPEPARPAALSRSETPGTEGDRPVGRIQGWLAVLAPEFGRPHLEVALVLVTVCLSLGLLEYYGKPYYYPPSRVPSEEHITEIRNTAADLRAQYPDALDWESNSIGGSRHRFALAPFIWWAGACALTYALLPLAIALLITRGRLREVGWLGLSPRGFLRHFWIYLVLLALVAPAVLIASHSREFRDTYPFCLIAHLSLRDWLVFEACYLFQFLCLEIFFRGFMLFTLERHMGRYAVLVMIVPYCMIHFGKPFPEAMGAIVAGLVLGELALRLRSIWGGVVLHCLVAISMDILSMYHTGSLEILLSPK